MMLPFKGKRYGQKYDEFSYKENVIIVGGKHRGRAAFVIGETTWKVHVCFPNGSISTLDKCDVQGGAGDDGGTVSDRTTPTAEAVEVVPPSAAVLKTEPGVSEHVGLETDTRCALRLLMVCFERQGINPTSTDAYKLFCDFAEEYNKNLLYILVVVYVISLLYYLYYIIVKKMKSEVEKKHSSLCISYKGCLSPLFLFLTFGSCFFKYFKYSDTDIPCVTCSFSIISDALSFLCSLVPMVSQLARALIICCKYVHLP